MSTVLNARSCKVVRPSESQSTPHLIQQHCSSLQLSSHSPTLPLPPSPTHPSQLLCQTFKDYLRDQGVTPDALADLLEFYSAFEQHCYTEEFLKGVRAFLDGKN